MILCQAVKRHVLGDAFTIDDLYLERVLDQYLGILNKFTDNIPRGQKPPPFGIHSICEEGRKNLNLAPGEWYGPQMISLVLRNLNNTLNPIP